MERITPAKETFSAKALATFREMFKLESECTCTDDADEDFCAACYARWDLEKVLLDELKLKPWQFPAVEIPGTPPIYPKGSPADRECQQAQYLVWQQGPQKARNASFCGVVPTLAERAVPTASDMRSRHRFVHHFCRY